MADDESSDPDGEEELERTANALENSMVACAAGFTAALGRYFGLTPEAITEVMTGMAKEVDDMLSNLTKERSSPPSLHIVKGPTKH